MVEETRVSFYEYNPSKVAAFVFTIAFGITTVLHFVQLIRKRAWFLIPLLIGGICMFLISSAATTFAEL